jgi:filamentous hemagglutinin family protein
MWGISVLLNKNIVMLLKKSFWANLGLLLYFFLHTTETQAQIVPDNSLPNDSTAIREGNIINIEGGTIREDNLFHSFSQFSIPQELEAVFNNEAGIVNIFTRITGDSASSINGLLSANGSANLFLINPNGIIFGNNAQLDIGGSFLATTAKAIEFSDDTSFDAVEPENSILTISVPIGLDFGTNTDSISGNSSVININGSGHTLDARGGKSAVRGEIENSLTVLPSKTLALIGNEINFDGGVLVSPSGNIEVGGVRQGEVRMINSDGNEGKWIFNYEGVEIFGDINLATRSLLDVSSIPNNPQLSGGTVSVQGSNIFSRDGSVILNQNFGKNDAGSIRVNASESFEISGTDPIARILGGIRTETLLEGDGSDIQISTPRLTISDGGAIQTLSYSPFPETASGNINFDVPDFQVLGASPRSAISVSNVITFTFGLSKAGNVSIKSDTVAVENGGALGSSGILGSVGEIIIDAKKYIRVRGFQPTAFLPSNIISTNSSSPNPGIVNITTPNLYIQDGGNISTSTFAGGSAGSIFINTDNLEITGAIPQSIFLDSEVPSNISSSTASFDSAFIESLPETIDIEDFLNLALEGDSGNIEINADSIQIKDSGQITVANSGSGDAGNIKINADSLNVEGFASINASTFSGRGGNISLRSENLELLDNSLISASAREESNGGNIIIDSTTIVGLNSSDIIANAIGGNGGNITINAQGIFFDLSSEISASSELGIDGRIQITTPDVSFQRELEQSELEFVTAEKAIANSCLARSSGQASFNVGGNDELPKNPNSNYSDANFSLTGVGSLPSMPKKSSPNPINQNQALIPAEKMVETKDGRIFLVTAPYAKRYPLGQKPESLFCPKN